ncbi:50S ribosomal protein L24 [Candidatus Uhrbacteria bacterium]|nr:50S ribosomal protein L24 [Candidatus Uhrbacteria bacterium]
MKIKKGDKVKIMVGKNAGKDGKVTQVFPQENRLVVDGVNKIVKHLKARGEGAKGQKLELFAPISGSNVVLICPKCGKNTRVGYKLSENNKMRICKKCKEVI